MEQSPSWEANRSYAGQVIPAIYETQRFMTAFTITQVIFVTITHQNNWLET
jgi:hypothetical protein